MYKYFNNVLNISKHIMSCVINEGDVVIDATVGNGNDTVFLAKLVGNAGKVYGFDIQDKAIINTQEKLEREGLDARVDLIKDSHANMRSHVHELASLIVFNLGYLPSGDHNIVTKSKTTIQAVKESLNILKANGVLIVASYTGHPEGKEEKEDLEDVIKGINQKSFNVLKFDFINQINNPPILYVIEKK